MSFINIFRLVAISLSLFFGLVVLGLTAHWTQGTLSIAGNVGGEVYDFEVVALLAGALTALALPLLLVIGMIRKGAWPTMIAVELPILTVLWILFLVNGALTAQWQDIFYPFGCGDTFDLDVTQQGWCREFFAILGLSFVIWIALFLYTVTLLVYALIGHSRGNAVWMTSVSEANFFAKKPDNGLLQAGGATVYQNTGGTYPPAPMQQYPMAQQYTGPAPMHNGLPQV